MHTKQAPRRTNRKIENVLFELVDGQLRPKLPWKMVRGPRIAADGQRYLSVDQAAERLGVDRDQACEIFSRVYGTLAG